MSLAAQLKLRIKAARKRRAWWARMLDMLRLLPSAEGRSRLWTRLVHGDEVHQTTPQTAEDRYPQLLDLAAKLAPTAERILSFGCSTGEELASLRRRFADAEIVGAEINPRSRAIARRRVRNDARTSVVGPKEIRGSFDLMVALAVFQREPHKIAEMDIDDLSAIYPFGRFDRAVRDLVTRLRPGGLLCVDHAMYRVEDSSAVVELEPVTESPPNDSLLFGRDGRRLRRASGRTLFRKRGRAERRGGARPRRRPAS